MIDYQRPPETVAEVRGLARRLGIGWGDVQAAAKMVRAQEKQARADLDELRQTAWCCNRPGSWPFWRHGFKSRWGKRVDDHDYTVIRGHDTLHQECVASLGLFADDLKGFWDFLMSDYQPLDPWPTVLLAAIGELEEARQSVAAPVPDVDEWSVEPVPF